jgi:hypothetical protein
VMTKRPQKRVRIHKICEARQRDDLREPDSQGTLVS